MPLGPFRMAARQKPKLLAILRHYKLDETLRCGHVRRAFQDRNPIGANGGKVLRQGEGQIRSTPDGNLGDRKEIYGRGISGFAESDILGSGWRQAIKLAHVPPKLRENLPASFPTVGLKEGFEHHVHRAAIARITS